MDENERNGGDPFPEPGNRPMPAPPLTSKTKLSDDRTFDLRRRRDQLNARVAELQWDLGGLAYEMAVRDHYRLDVIARKAAELQQADAELGEVQRLLATTEAGIDGQCRACGAVHSRGASYCWHCGAPLLCEARPATLSAAGQDQM